MELADLPRCPDCYAYVQSKTNHDNWHRKIKRQIRDLEAAVARLKRDMP